MQDVKWEVRKANSEDVASIVGLSRNHEEFLMPYTFNPFVVGKYIDQFIIAEAPNMSIEGAQDLLMPSLLTNIGGALHVVPSGGSVCGKEDFDRAVSFLFYVKQVPVDIIVGFFEREDIAIFGQIVCPGKASFYHILEEVKKQYSELWCWMSVVGPSYKAYQRYGFEFSEEREFWNVYKCGYSKFTLGKWIKKEA